MRRHPRARIALSALVAAVTLAIGGTAAAGAATWSFESLDGPGVPGGNGRTTDGLSSQGSSLVLGGQTHTFYTDFTASRLRHAWSDGTTWRFEDLDGPGVPGGNGRTTDGVGWSISAAVFGGQPHVWYYHGTAKRLRHAWWNGSTWRFEDLDGSGVAGGNGRTADRVGRFATATIFAGQPHVWYEDFTALTLRHAWWDGATWRFENLDGTGVPGGNGRTTHFVGQAIAATVYGNGPHVWYEDYSMYRVRHAWWDGATWRFENLDGTGVPGGNGRVANAVGYYLAVTVFAGAPHVWYLDGSMNRLRHAWWDGATWRFENLDGPGVPGGNGRSAQNTGSYSTALIVSGVPHVWYQEVIAGRLRHAWWDGAAWRFENLDGPGAPGGNGRTAGYTGRYPFVAMVGAQVHLWYFGDTPYVLRHARYA